MSSVAVFLSSVVKPKTKTKNNTMSKTTTIKSVPIKDIQALQAAVDELKAAGINCSLLQNADCRLWYSTKKCDYVLSLPDCQFDLGIQKESDGSYSTVTDLHGGLVNGQIGATCPVKGTDPNDLAIGRFMQAYSKHATLNAVAAAGYSVSDLTFNPDTGEVTIEAMVMA